ncbi:hypothetical protein [Lentibacillus sp. CBA3610]|uniref:thiolase family protein n=1 Tax=Lentibacillus sp. CBA3610 TaxID=2518176 RepID=UPI0020D21EF6|nr:hypothetical protein [Lentibacillus sp. CBA3610]
MGEAYIIDSVRTAVGKMGGSLKDVPAEYLAAKVIGEMTRRIKIDKEHVDEVILGHTKQSADNPNIARTCYVTGKSPC